MPDGPEREGQPPATRADNWWARADDPPPTTAGDQPARAPTTFALTVVRNSDGALGICAGCLLPHAVRDGLIAPHDLGHRRCAGAGLGPRVDDREAADRLAAARAVREGLSALALRHLLELLDGRYWWPRDSGEWSVARALERRGLVRRNVRRGDPPYELADAGRAAALALVDHPFVPLTFTGPNGPFSTDWCGHLYDPVPTGPESICGNAAAHHHPPGS